MIEMRTFRNGGITLLALTATLIPWLIRTELVTGAPVLFSPGGVSLFKSNNEFVFQIFPQRSIDLVAKPAFSTLSPNERAELARASTDDPNGIKASGWLWKKGTGYIKTHPLETLAGGIRKIGIGFSPIFSPRKGMVEEIVYFVSYFPLLLGAMAGAWLGRHRWRQLGYVYAMVFGFAAVTAIFWAHTSHRMYLDPYLMILTAYACTRAHRRSQSNTARI
jgi:hypothetical protein